VPGRLRSFRACHQIIGVLADRDAVGNHAIQVQHALRSRGLRSVIYAAKVVGRPGGDVAPLDALPADDQHTALLYQASARSPAADVALARTEPLLLNYHNVTPGSFFAPWEPEIADEMEAARREIADLAQRSVVGLADSQYNAGELRAMGCPQVEVVPVLIDLEPFWTEPPQPPAATEWLFVGRLCPNKAQHDVIKSFALYRKLYDHSARLTLVGRSSSHHYEKALGRLTRGLRIAHAVQFLGSVRDTDLQRLYRRADVFVCLSEHEGFCNTVVEAMAARTPVVAYASSALPETVGAGGLLLDDKDPLRVATAVRRILTDECLRSSLIAAGARRASALDLGRARQSLGAALDRIDW
jgi:glycosyltransferase involved in cell wall biosynthesis